MKYVELVFDGLRTEASVLQMCQGNIRRRWKNIQHHLKKAEKKTGFMSKKSEEDLNEARNTVLPQDPTQDECSHTSLNLWEDLRSHISNRSPHMAGKNTAENTSTELRWDQTGLAAGFTGSFTGTRGQILLKKCVCSPGRREPECDGPDS